MLDPIKQQDTPLMRQYNDIKSKHPDALLLFRVGDFMRLLDQMQYWQVKF